VVHPTIRRARAQKSKQIANRGSIRQLGCLIRDTGHLPQHAKVQHPNPHQLRIPEPPLRASVFLNRSSLPDKGIQVDCLDTNRTSNYLSPIPEIVRPVAPSPIAGNVYSSSPCATSVQAPNFDSTLKIQEPFMRLVVLSLALLPACSATLAQQTTSPTSGTGWQKVQMLPAGANINVKTRTGHASCKLKSVDADSLTCTHGKDFTFQRTDIVNIRIPHRGRSTLIGLAAGGGVGAIIGAAATHGSPCNQFCFISSADVALATGLAGGVVGAVVGVTTDFTRSTVYKAP
jgi:hypothetical protein